MKTRIISGAVMVAIVSSVLVLGTLWHPLVIIAFVALIAGIGTYELVHNAAKVNDIWCEILASVYTSTIVFAFTSWLKGLQLLALNNSYAVEIDYSLVYSAPLAVVLISVIYVLAMAALILVRHKSIDFSHIGYLCAMPILYAFGFSALAGIITGVNGIYYLLLILNFACICDTGAYFTGVTLGKHKLCPEISPKKTIEGAVGGILSGLIVSVIIVLCFKNYDKLLLTLLLTIPLCAIGMMGDLFASIIKRKADIKDYGWLIPGHGGVLDRTDSILLISPALYCLILLGVI